MTIHGLLGPHRLQQVAAVVLLLGAFGSGCQEAAPQKTASVAPPQPSAVAQPTSTIQEIDLKLDDINGLSGLAVDGKGVVWAVPERNALLLQLGATRVERRLIIRGVPDGLDLEALAWLGGSRFAIGTESMVTPRASELVLVVDVGDDRAAVVDHIDIPYDKLGIQGEVNRGIEGLCFAGGHLLAAFEQVMETDGQRYAIIADYAANRELRVFRLQVTTRTGKVSGMDCRVAGNKLEVIAIERHFGVHRLITFDVPTDVSSGVIAARLLLSLEGRISATLNPEGLVWSGKSLLVIIDNQYGTRTGPNVLLRITMPERVP